MDFKQIFLLLFFDNSFDIRFPGMKLFTDDHKIHVEGNVSQTFYLGLSFNSMSKNGKLFVNFSNFIF